MSENEVKQRFIPFLRDFYRHRYEPISGSESVETDNVAEGGVVADGKMSFRKSDGSPFVCTYEATSQDKAEEVKYVLNIYYFLWDCFAFSMLVAAAIYVAFYIGRLPWLISLYSIGNIGLIIGTGMIAFFGWYFAMQRWRKYRFIHAIAQFKQYQADEQWIALADDVFPSPIDPYLIELRSQCVYHGFGLALIPPDDLVKVLITPSRLGVYGKNRKMVDWVTKKEWYQNVSQGVGTVAKVKPPDKLTIIWNKITNSLRYLVYDPVRNAFLSGITRTLGASNSGYTRFMNAQGIQKWVAALSMVVILPLFLKVISHRDTETADLVKMREWKSGANPEDQYGYVIDGDAIPYDDIPPLGITKQKPVSIKRKPASTTPVVEEIDLSNDDTEIEVETITISDTKEDPKPQTASVEKKKEKPKVAPKAKGACAKVSGQKGWIIQDNAFSNTQNAINRVEVLQEKSILADKLALSCLQSGAKGTIVMLGGVYATESKAQAQLKTFEKALKKAGLLKGRLLLRKLP